MSDFWIKFMGAFLIVVGLLFIASCVHDRVEHRRSEEDDQRSPSDRILFGMWLVPMTLLILALTVWAAHARDDGRYAQSPLKGWFDQLKSGKGLCCSDADGTALSDVDWESRDGRYRVRIPDNQGKLEWFDVPDEAVITEPNRAGKTMVWPMRGYMGITIRCFMPGTMI